MNQPPNKGNSTLYRQVAQPVTKGWNALGNTIKKWTASINESMYSPSYITKIAVSLLILFVLYILYRLLSYIIFYNVSTYKYMLLSGTHDAKYLRIIPQDPNVPSAVTLPRSFNEDKGIEFTWSVWMYIEDLVYKNGEYKCVFYKGNDFNSDPTQAGINFPNNGPGVYIDSATNEIIIYMNTYTDIVEKVNIPNIPMNKWMNLLLRCEGNILDVYVNGSIIQSVELDGVPKQNYGDVYVCPNGGFSGYISDLTYYSRALHIQQIDDIVSAGPNKTLASSSSHLGASSNNYLSLQWFFG